MDKDDKILVGAIVLTPLLLLIITFLVQNEPYTPGM